MLAGYIGAVELAELAARAAAGEWRLQSSDLRRLSELTAQDVPKSDYGLTAVVEIKSGSEGFPVLHLVVTGNWPLVCQRCLSGVTHVVEIESELTILPDEPSTKLVADPFDCVLMPADGVRLLDVIEDEVLAALPMAPAHEEPMMCAGGIHEALPPVAEETKSNRPFAGLAGLIENVGTDTTG